MNNLEEIEKLNTLKEKGIISDAEFQEQKVALLNKSQYGNKSQLCYVLLAFFFGILGIHNFYAGRWKRGLVQLLITLLTLFIGSVFTGLWAIINIFRIHTDGKGGEFQPCPVAKYICGILGILNYIWLGIFVVGVLVVGGIAGYTMAMNKYQANEIMSYVAQTQVMASASEGQMTDVQSCSSLLGETSPYIENCLVAPDGTVQITLRNDALKQVVKSIAGNVQETQNGDLIIPRLY